ncbi:MAG: 50S ribosomal protein L21 [Bacilli bacterium]|jgi:large subunit ribosomal protein L21|nr:50S ribosomal protein L21 [Bacilli bacterium]
MFAVIETGGKQIRVEVGQSVFVEKIEGKEGDEVVFDKVLLLDGDSLKVGTPYIEGAKVVGKIEKQGRSPKIVVFKYRAKVNYRRTTGHRQPYTKVNITSIA